MRALAVVLMMLLPGCMTLPADPAKMSAEQLTAWAKDRNANIACTVINSPYGRGVATYVVLDKGIVINGNVTVDGECKVSVSNDSRQAK
jgi:hypothetical protein